MKIKEEPDDDYCYDYNVKTEHVHVVDSIVEPTNDSKEGGFTFDTTDTIHIKVEPEINFQFHDPEEDGEDCLQSPDFVRTAKKKTRVSKACRICESNYSDSSKLRRHIKTVHNNFLVFLSNEFSSTIDEQLNVVQNCHLKSLEIPSLEEFKSSNEVKPKCVIKRRKKSTRVLTYICRVCDETDRYITNNSARLKRHMSGIHKEYISFLAGRYETTFQNQLQMLQQCHLQHREIPDLELFKNTNENAIREQKIEIVSKPINGESSGLLPTSSKQVKIFACKLCPYTAKYKRFLVRHIKINHETEKPFSCSRCAYTSAVRGGVLRHMKSVHQPSVPFHCELCDYSTPRKNNLKAHVRTVHENLKPFSCDECNFHTAYKHALENHKVAIHGSGTPYKCDQCTYTAAQKSNLLTHIQVVHYKMKSFMCPECSYSTGRKRDLQCHDKNVHKKIKAFSCDRCPYSATLKSSVSTHIRRVHDRHKFKCDQCTFTTNEAMKYFQHVTICKIIPLENVEVKMEES